MLLFPPVEECGILLLSCVATQQKKIFSSSASKAYVVKRLACTFSGVFEFLPPGPGHCPFVQLPRVRIQSVPVRIFKEQSGVYTTVLYECYCRNKPSNLECPVREESSVYRTMYVRVSYRSERWLPVYGIAQLFPLLISELDRFPTCVHPGTPLTKT